MPFIYLEVMISERKKKYYVMLHQMILLKDITPSSTKLGTLRQETFLQNMCYVKTDFRRNVYQ